VFEKMKVEVEFFTFKSILLQLSKNKKNKKGSGLEK
jgi:hypothetical protein